MSSKKSKIDASDQHLPAEDAKDPQAHLEDVMPAAAEQADSEAESVEQQLLQAQQTIKDYWDQMMRLRAEIDNNRKRAERDIEAAHKFALRSFFESLLPVIDGMEMGEIAAVSQNATLESIREGNTLTMNLLVNLLQKHGLEQINPVGEKFDPERHQAISMIDHDQVESKRVIEVMQKGFMLNDRLVRPAMVVVAK